MANIHVLLVISMLATVAPAAVKRDDFPSSPSAVTGTSQTSSGSPSQYQDHSAAASTNNYQSQPGNSQGNLYYYYYPVQDKPKETGYQASASNQYSSAVTPNSDGSATQHVDASQQNQAANPSDLSYSAQDLSYSAQAMNPGMNEYSGSAQASANYDQQLSSLASQLQQQYGYATQGNSAPSSYGGSSQQQSYGQSYSYDPSQQQSHGQMEQAGQFSASNQVPNYGIAGQQAQFIPAQQAQQLAGFNPAAAQAAAQSIYAQYPGAAGLHFGNFAAGSGPQSSFEPAASGYRRYGIGSFIMPMLALAGLSLLIPTVTSLTASGRKKRSIEGVDSAKESAFGDYFDRLERYYSIYKTATEREECLNRIICELGDAMSGVKGKSTLFSDVSFKVLEKIVPTWMGNQVGVFKSAAQTSGEFGKCKKYTCQK